MSNIDNRDDGPVGAACMLPGTPPIAEPDHNPLFAIWRRYNDVASIDDPDAWWRVPARASFDLQLEQLKHRRELCARYSWAVPHPASLDAIAACGPIVEIGAGAGYWAALLRLRRVDIICYDRDPPTHAEHSNTWHSGLEATFTTVLTGGPEKAADHPDRALFLCWPPYDEPMAMECLSAYKGDTLLYVGEGGGGCNGDDAFWEAIENEWRLERRVRIPQWYGIHDELMIYRRRREEEAEG